MKVVFHGGAREVGRSCVEVATSSKRLLLDCGLKLTAKESEYPIAFEQFDDINAVFISHAHLDHTGALPWMDNKGMTCPIFMTKSTRDLTKLILKDAFKVGKINHQHLGYGENDIKKVLNCIRRAVTDVRGNVDGISFEYFDAGHIPGSAAVQVDVEGKRILYTGDINTVDTLLLNHADTDYPDIDVLICESTYGDREHPLRTKVEGEFINAITEVLKRGGIALVPVFAIGRAQEILLLLAKYKWKVPIYIDGMSIAATDIILGNPDDIANDSALKSAYSKAKLVSKDSERIAALKGPGIIITTSGMLTGGPVVSYLKYMHTNTLNAVLITGYQAKDTNGRLLMETGDIYIDGMKKHVDCEVRQFDFSAHAGRAQLKELVRTIHPAYVFFMHGDEKACLELTEWAQAIGMKSFAPHIGESYDI